MFNHQRKEILKSQFCSFVHSILENAMYKCCAFYVANFNEEKLVFFAHFIILLYTFFIICYNCIIVKAKSACCIFELSKQLQCCPLVLIY